MDINRKIFFAALILALTGCGSGTKLADTNGSNGDTGTGTGSGGNNFELETGPIKLSGNFVVGTDSSVTSGPEIIDPNMKLASNYQNGEFLMSWGVDTQKGYIASVYLSDDNALNPDQDVEIYTGNCGNVAGLTCHTDTGLNCHFTTDNKLYCDDHKPVDITSHLTSLPADKYLIIRACNALATSCDTSAIPVIFR